MNMIEKIKQEKLVPVVKLDNAKDAMPLAEALMKGGINVMEITFRTAAAAESIATIAKEFPDIILGAGTVLTLEQLSAAAEAGSTFMVLPGFNPKITEEAIKRGFPVIPGVISPAEVEQAMNYGLTTLKFFPASVAGGIPMLKTFNSVYPMVGFMPTGGLNNDNFIDYLSCPNVIACGGSWMVAPKLIAEGNFAEITRLSKAAKERIAAELS